MEQVQAIYADDMVTLQLSGHIDTNNASEIEEQCNDALNVGPEIPVIIDAANLEYISSAGLRVLLTVHKLMAAKGGSFIVLHPCDEVSEIFEMTGFSSFLVIEK